jgi:hypothetical protein
MSLPLPNELIRLLTDGLWPDQQSAQRQNLHPLIPKEVVRQFAPEEETIFLYPPPFQTVAEARKHNKFWEDKRSALNEIDPELALIVGDFGLGSDAAIILDYRAGEPRLFRLQWGEHGNHWVACGIKMADFATQIRRAIRPSIK